MIRKIVVPRAIVDAERHKLVVVPEVRERRLSQEEMTAGKKAVMQVTRTTGLTRHELVHAAGHFMRLQHADSLNCIASGARVPFSDTCTVEPASDPYDSMGEGTGTFSAGAISALGWLRDSQHQVAQAPNDDVRRSFQLGAITDGGLATPFSTRAVRFSDGGTNFWLEYRSRTGIDSTEAPFPALGGIGVVLHKEIRPAFGREPSFQLIDLSPSSPRSDAGLKLPLQSWENPLGRLKVTFTNFATGGATITIGPKPGTAPVRPTSPTALIVQLGWDGQVGGTGAPEDLRPQLELTNASNQASSWFEEVSGGVKSWKTHYAAVTIPTPRSEFVGDGLPNRCNAQTFADIDAGAEAALRARGFVPTDYVHIFYVYNGAVCQSMPDERGTALPAPNRVVVQATGANFGTEFARSQTLVEAVGHQLGLAHSPARSCVFDRDPDLRVPFSRTCSNQRDPNGAMGGGSGSFSARELIQLGYLPSTELASEPAPGTSVTQTLAPLTAGRNRAPGFEKRAMGVFNPGTGFWIEYRQPIGVDAAANASGVFVYHQEQHQTATGTTSTYHLLDMTPETPMSDAALPVGRTWDNQTFNWTLKVESADSSGAVITVTRYNGGEFDFPEPLPHPVPPANPDPKRSMLVLNVGWDDPEGSVTPDATLPDKGAYTVNEYVNEWYRESAPAGLYEDWRAYAGGSFRIPSPMVPGGEECDVDAIWSDAEDAARRRGIEPDRFGHVMVVIAASPCGFGGFAPFNGRRSILTIGLRFVPHHELGHNIGLPHAGSIECFSQFGSERQKTVPLSSQCTTRSTGDLVDMMGGGVGSFNPIYANQLGWLKNQFVSLEAGPYEKAIEIVPWMGAAPPIEGRKRAIRLVDGETTLWMEWREAVGPDALVKPGLYIRREIPPRSSGYSQLLDMTPETPREESALPVGQTWANPLGTMEITLNRGGASGAVVTIKRQGGGMQVPDLTGDTQAEAGAELTPLGLQFGRITGHVEDCVGTFINRVFDQDPKPGTLVAPGTTVNVRMGVKPENMNTCQ